MPLSPDKTCCGQMLRFDETIVGKTCGGLELRGWGVCDVCGAIRIHALSRPASADEGGEWTVSHGGASVDAGAFRIRAEAAARGRGRASNAIADLMRRIARVPELERALRRIAAGEDSAEAIARAALEVGE